MGNLEEKKNMQAPVCVTLLKIHKAIWKTINSKAYKYTQFIDTTGNRSPIGILIYIYSKQICFCVYFLSETSAKWLRKVENWK